MGTKQPTTCRDSQLMPCPVIPFRLCHHARARLLPKEVQAPAATASQCMEASAFFRLDVALEQC